MSSRPKLHPYQDVGATFLAERGFAMLGDDPGLGKSAQALTAAEYVTARKALILCPAIAQVSWIKEINRWSKGTGFDIFTYDKLALDKDGSLRASIMRQNYDVLILDEAHYLKNKGANRTKYVYRPKEGIAKTIPRVWALSGTFMPNHAGELWPHLMFGGVTKLRSEEFEDQFCTVRNTVYGRQITGTKRSEIPALKALMKPIFLRRRKADVLDELPPLQFEIEPLEIKPTTDMTTPDFATLSDEELLAAITRSTADPQVSSARKAIGLAKVLPAVDWIESQDFRKVIVFAHHREVMDELESLMSERNPVRIDGSTSHKDRMAAVNRFQEDPECRLFIGQTTAAGTAITLTAAKDVLILEPSWVPGENYQAACRAHRIGQKDGVLCRFLMAPGTFDDRVSKVFMRKAREIAELFE